MDDQQGVPIRSDPLAAGSDEHLQRLCNLIVAINEALIQATSPQEIFDHACEIAVAYGCDMSAVRMLDQDAEQLKTVAMSGDNPDSAKMPIAIPLSTSSVDTYALERRAFQEGQTQIDTDYAAAIRCSTSTPAGEKPELAAWFAASYPLCRQQEVVGIFSIYAGKKRVLDDETKTALQRLANNISFALGNFKREEERAKVENALTNERDLMRGLMENIPDAIYFKDRELRFLYVNAALTKIIGLSHPDEVIGHRSVELLPRDIAEKTEQEDSHILFESGVPIIDQELQVKMSDDHTLWLSKTAVPIRNQQGEIIAMVGIARDITARKESETRIQYLATHDGLTALPNRLKFTEVLGAAVKSAQRYERHFAVMFIDLDRFKIVNDTLGHEAGDLLLKEMAARLSACLRAGDVLARLGGDEFVVLLEEIVTPEPATAVAKKILSAILRPVSIFGQECRVTASIGIALYPVAGRDEQTLMKNADAAMYAAKEEGKNTYQFYSAETRAHGAERLLLETKLRTALEQDEFVLDYQSQVDMQGRITGVEALLRWHQPELGLLSPLQFIPVAEETGLIVPIGRWVLREACAQNVAWQRQGLPPLCMAVNLSPRQFNDPALLADIRRVLADTGMEARWLELEITEGMVMHDIEHASRLLMAIKELGVKIALDDFGTGYSSLAQLKRFPIDTLKVDRSFIRELSTDAEDQAITEAIIAMGRSLSLNIIAEGVENSEQESFLREHACDQMQGYYFSKPVPPEQFSALLLEQSGSRAPPREKT